MAHQTRKPAEPRVPPARLDAASAAGVAQTMQALAARPGPPNLLAHLIEYEIHYWIR